MALAFHYKLDYIIMPLQRIVQLYDYTIAHLLHLLTCSTNFHYMNLSIAIHLNNILGDNTSATIVMKFINIYDKITW